MKARLLILVACISLVATTALAHGGMEHVIGTVAKIAQDSITVKTTANKMVTVSVVPETKFIMGKMAMKLDDLKVGQRVVIHAKEPKEGTLVADTVEFGAAKPAQSGSGQTGTSHAGMEMLTGVVSDSTCGATHMMKNMTAAECTRACAKTSGYALVAGKDVYTLKGHEAELDKLAAEKVTVKGTLNGKTVTVESVTLAKKG